MTADKGSRVNNCFFKMRNMFKSSVDSKRLMLMKGENTEAVFLGHREEIEYTE